VGEHLPLPHAWAWALAACIVAAALEGILSGARVRRRIAELRQPRPSPPLWTWSLIGLAYYVLFFLILGSLLNRPSSPGWTTAAIGLVVALLLANAVWNLVFFRWKDLWLARVAFGPYLLAALALGVALLRLGNAFIIGYIFYLAYLGYAAWWAHGVWRLNDSR
jgi:tryptophan-rich sensory protein